MAEAHQTEVVVLVLGALDGGFHLVRRTDFFEHLQHGFVGAAVCRAPQRRDAGSDGCIWIGARRAHQTHRGRGCVLLVIGVQDKKQIQRLRRHRAHFQRLARHFEHHVQEAIDVFEVVARITERPADRVSIAGSGDGRHLGDQTDRGKLAVVGVIDIQRLVIEGRQRGDRRGQHGHRVRVVMEALEKIPLRLVHHRVMRDVVFEAGELGLVRQLAVEQQVGHLEEGRLFSQLLDRVTAIHQDALIAIDVRDRTLGGGSAAVTGVVGEMPGVLVQRSNVDTSGTNRTGQQRELAATAIGFIYQLDGFGIGHRNLLRMSRHRGDRITAPAGEGKVHGRGERSCNPPIIAHRSGNIRGRTVH